MRWRIALAIAVIASVGWARPALAAPTPGLISVSPPLQELTLTSNSTSESYNLVVGNGTATTQQFSVKTSDFGALDDSGGIAFLGANASELQKKYGLANWLQLDRTQFSLAPGAEQTIKVTVLNQPTLAPGGHYGAVLVGQEAPAVSAEGNRVSFHNIASSLVFVKKLGGEVYGLNLEQITQPTHWWQNLELDLHFRNTGNVYVVPRGVVRLIDPVGHELARGTINEQSSFILPETMRIFPVEPHLVAPLVWPGRYRLEVDYRYDGEASFRHFTTSLWYINWTGGLLILGLIGAVLGILLYGLRRWSKKPANDHSKRLE